MDAPTDGIPAGGGRRVVVVGAGPNGLTGAALLARAGYAVEVFEAAPTVGGGTRTSELTVPGLRHDHCSAFHPTALLSPAFAALGTDLERHGLRWAWPEVEFAHPLLNGRGAALHRSVDETATGLGADGAAWRRTFGALSAHLDELAADVLGPLVRIPRHPIRLGRFGLDALRPASWLARRWSSDEGRGLFAGAAARVIHPLDRPLTASVGLMLVATGHAVGWPVAVGGSQSIADALAAIVTEAGGRIHTGHAVDDLAAAGPAEIVLLDVAPGAAADLLGDRLPSRVRRAYGRYRYGPAVFKLDLAVDGGVPWAYEPCRRAGTVHVGGTFEEIAVAEREVHAGRMPDRPFMLVGQQYLADPTRSVGSVHPVWAYCHVPHGYPGDAAEAIVAHIERYAPGVRDRIVATTSRSAPEFAVYDRNFVGGDIATGANDGRQVLFRPRIALDPYATGVPGVYLCSAATPPGAGVHGMGGYHAARRAARAITRRGR